MAEEAAKSSILAPNLPLYKKPLSLGLLLAAITFTLFFPATRNGFVNFDDNLYVTENAWVKHGLTSEGVKHAFTTSVSANWHPLTMLSHMLDCQLFGLHAWGHHLTSVLLHAVSAALLFLALYGMTGARWRTFFVALVFAVHPLRVESVAWVAERKDVLSGFFFMLVLLFYGKYAGQKSECRMSNVERNPKGSNPKGEPKQQKGIQQEGTEKTSASSLRRLQPKTWYLLTLLAFAGGLMSKPMVVTVPFVLLLLDFWPLGRFSVSGPSIAGSRASIPQLLIEKIPFFVLTIGSCLITMRVQAHAGAVAQILPLSDRLTNAVVSYVRYIGDFFVPANLCVPYPHQEHWSTGVLLGSLILVAVLTLVAVVRARQWPWLLSGWFWYVGTLVPVIGIVQVGQQSMADRYTYIPLIGVTWAVVWALGSVVKMNSRRISMVVIVFGAASVISAAITLRQIGYWQNSVTLFKRAVAVTKDNWIAYGNLAKALADHGKIDEAISNYRRVLEIKPGDPIATSALAVMLAKSGDTKASGEAISSVLKDHPDDAGAHNNLGLVLAQKGDLEGAQKEFETATKLEPNLADAHHNLGLILATKGQVQASIKEYEAAIRIKPDYVKARKNLAISLYRAGQIDAAIAQLQEALKIEPSNQELRGRLNYLMKNRSGSAPPK